MKEKKPRAGAPERGPFAARPLRYAAAVPLRSRLGGPGRVPPVTAVTSDGAVCAVSRVEPWSARMKKMCFTP